MPVPRRDRKKRCKQIVKLLIEKGIDINQTDKNRKNASIPIHSEQINKYLNKKKLKTTK